MNAPNSKRILVLGASGLIGYAIATDLMRRGFTVVAAARQFTPAQRNQLGAAAKETQIVGLGVADLMRLVTDSAADMAVNCLGVLQDSPGNAAHDVHDEFVQRLLTALRAAGRSILLVHLSIPGEAADDRTEFSRSKRSGERHIAESKLSYAILRPGFVLAPAAFGGSALFRALAALPVDLPDLENSRPISFVAVDDIAETVAILARKEPGGGHAAIWDVVHPEQSRVGDVVAGLRHWLGAVSGWRIKLPAFLLDLGAKAGDLVALLGWRPPIRSTALAELRRGVTGDARAWIAATGIAPRSLASVLATRPADLQEKWFARLYLLKPLVVLSLVVFWIVSGLIALTVAYGPAVAILTERGFSNVPAQAMTIASSLMDIAVGLLIAVRRSCRAGLLAGVAVSLCYMVGAAIITPDLWIEPLGALVKTGPAIVLMLVALAILDER